MNDEENIDYGDRDASMQIYAFHLKKIEIQMERDQFDETEKSINLAINSLPE